MNSVMPESRARSSDVKFEVENRVVGSATKWLSKELKLCKKVVKTKANKKIKEKRAGRSPKLESNIKNLKE